MGIIGLIANPASGKDVRRLVARASVFDNQEKGAILRRVLAGIASTPGDKRIAFLDDPHGIASRALEESATGLHSDPVAASRTASALDTTTAARSMAALPCSAVLTLGGDGTNRAVVKGWPDAPLIPVSTGTNNVFPMLLEATVAGAAAGLIGGGTVALDEVAGRHKLIHVEIEGEDDDVALIDAVLSRERFVGARALLDPERIDSVLLTRADPAAIGMTALGGLVQPLAATDDGALAVSVGADGESWQVPIAPGHYREVRITACRLVEPGEVVTFRGPGVVAFDGERERTLKPDQAARLTVRRDGPWVVDVHRTLALAAERRAFHLGG